MRKQKFYAYLVNGKKGVTDNWPECQKIVTGVADAKFKGFVTQNEAERWLDAGANYNIKHIAAEKGIYFDAGTGAGKGVEINVTDESGRGLLDKVLDKKQINQRGHHWIFDNVTNNFGELLACKYALQIAIKDNVKNIFGDSKLIIDYWSKGFLNKKDKSSETISVAGDVAKLRNKFERTGGTIKHIPGASNPADLGFHK